MTELAFLGTGVMGLPMARNLDEAGFAVHAYNRTVQRAGPLQDAGIAVFGDPAEAAEGCSVMVTMLSQGDAVLEVASGGAAGDRRAGDVDPDEHDRHRPRPNAARRWPTSTTRRSSMRRSSGPAGLPSRAP